MTKLKKACHEINNSNWKSYIFIKLRIILQDSEKINVSIFQTFEALLIQITKQPWRGFI